METIVHEALRDILFGDARGLFQWTHINNTFMGNHAAATGIEHGIMRGQLGRNIVRVKNCDLRSFQQTFGTHHGYVHP